MYSIGDLVPLSCTVKDANGALADAGAMNLTVTAPDGTSDNRGIQAHVSTGLYGFDYPTTMAGRYMAVWTATGANGGTYTEYAIILATDTQSFVSLRDAKDRCTIPLNDTSHDAQLETMIPACCAVIVGIIGDVLPTPYTETQDGGSATIMLRRFPVSKANIVSVVENGVDITSEIVLDEYTGVIIHQVYLYQRKHFRDGYQNIVITYKAGRTTIKPNIVHAALDLIELHMQGYMTGGLDPFDAANAVEVPPEAGRTLMGFFVPYSILEQLASEPRLDTGVS
jgi:hypothetical protein